MKLQRHLDALKDDLEQLASLADESVAETARRLTSALESSVRVRLLDVLSEAAAELSAAVVGGHPDHLQTPVRRRLPPGRRLLRARHACRPPACRPRARRRPRSADPAPPSHGGEPPMRSERWEAEQPIRVDVDVPAGRLRVDT